MVFKKNNKINLGRKFSEEHKRKISKSHIGIKHTEETKQKISKLNKGKLVGNKNPSKRKEVRDKISKSLMGHKGVFAGEKRPEHSKMMKGRKQSKEHIKKRFKKKKNTSIELIIEKTLNDLKLIYVKQEVIIGFCVDFYLPEYNLVIECDGDYWHNKPDVKKRDKIKNINFKKSNIQLLRLKEYDINNNLDLCIRRIQLIIQNGYNIMVK